MQTRKVVVVWITMALILVFLPQPVKAEQAAPDQVAVILILDNSGSMKTSDPADLRFTAVRLFISLLDDGDQVGLILFSTQSDKLTAEMVTLHGEADKRQLLDHTRFPAADGYTDIKAALFDAGDLLLMIQGNTGTTNASGKTVVVLLTDGKPEISQPYTAYEEEALGAARSLGVPVLSIALTTAAQTPFLNRLAAETGGMVVPADDAADLLDAYLEVFSQIKDRTVIGSGVTQSPGFAALEIEPTLAPYIAQASFILIKPENVQAKLFAPSGEEITSASQGAVAFLADDPRFMVVTSDHPTGGEWKFHTSGQGAVMGRAILHSRLRSEIISPARFHQAGQPMPIVVNLTEETGDETVKIIGEASFSALITRPDGTQESLDRFYDDGTHGDAVADDGDFTRLYVNTQQPGVYSLHIQGRKGIVPVEQTAQVEIVSFPRLVVDKPAGAYDVKGQPIQLQVHLEGGVPSVLDKGIITAQLTAPSGAGYEMELNEENGTFSGGFMPMEDGNYKVTFIPQDAFYKGLPYTTAAETEFQVTIVPVLIIQTSGIEVPAACSSAPRRFTMSVNISSTKAQQITFALENADGVTLSPSSLLVGPEEQQVILEFSSPNHPLLAGESQLTLLVEGAEGVEVLPSPKIALQYHVPSLWTRCQKPASWGGLLVFLLAAGLVAAQRIRQAALPPPVTGTLRHWPSGENMANAIEDDLTALRKNSLSIGRGEACDLVITEGGLAERHAILRAEKTIEREGAAQGTRILLEPLGEIKKSYRAILTPIPLSHGDRFSMAGREFQYLSDTGE